MSEPNFDFGSLAGKYAKPGETPTESPTQEVEPTLTPEVEESLTPDPVPTPEVDPEVVVEKTSEPEVEGVTEDKVSFDINDDSVVEESVKTNYSVDNPDKVSWFEDKASIYDMDTLNQTTELMDYLQDGGTVEEYFEVFSHDYGTWSEQDLILEKLSEEFPDLTDIELNDIYDAEYAEHEDMDTREKAGLRAKRLRESKAAVNEFQGEQENRKLSIKTDRTKEVQQREELAAQNAIVLSEAKSDLDGFFNKLGGKLSMNVSVNGNKSTLDLDVDIDMQNRITELITKPNAILERFQKDGKFDTIQFAEFAMKAELFDRAIKKSTADTQTKSLEHQSQLLKNPSKPNESTKKNVDSQRQEFINDRKSKYQSLGL